MTLYNAQHSTIGGPRRVHNGEYPMSPYLRCGVAVLFVIFQTPLILSRL
jgi:hypothetical protein